MNKETRYLPISLNGKVERLFLQENVDSMVSMLNSIVHAHNRGRVTKSVLSYVELLERVARHNGKQVACDLAKQIANNVKRLTLGLDAFYTYPINIKTTSCGIPRKLKNFRRFINSESAVLKGVVNSITNFYRTVELEPVVDYQSVTEESCGSFDGTYYEGYLAYLKTTLGPNIKMQLDRRGPDLIGPSYATIINSSTPYGPKSLVYAEKSAEALLHPSNKVYLSAILDLYRHYDRVTDVMHIQRLFDDLFLKNETEGGLTPTPGEYLTKTSALSKDYHKKHPKLAAYEFLADKGGKTRGITMANYFIQDALKKLHDDLMFALSKIPNDYTYRQECVPAFVKEMFTQGKKAFCYDMTGATDRFPRAVQTYLLSAVYGPTLAKAWETLVTVKIVHENYVLQFKAGQPMGLLSSFSTFALCHHGLVRYCGECCGNPYFEDYMVLGDDVVIFHPATAYLYEFILTNILGVKISKHKSILSTESVTCGEFCKRLFLSDKEITPLGSGLVAPVYLNISGLTTGIERILGWYGGSLTAVISIHNFTETYLRRFLGKSYKHFDSFFNVILIYLCIAQEVSDPVKRVFIQDLQVNSRYAANASMIFETSELERLESRYADYSDIHCAKLEIVNQGISEVISIVHPHAKAMWQSFEKLYPLLQEFEDRPLGHKMTRNRGLYLKRLDLLETVLNGVVAGRNTSDEVSQERERWETIRRIQRLRLLLLQGRLFGEPDQRGYSAKHTKEYARLT